MTEAAKVYDADERNGIETKIEDLSNQIKEYTQKRYEGYQTWAVEQCKKAFDAYKNRPKIQAPFSDKKIDYAHEIIYDYLINIDSALLTPAVSRLYQNILDKIFDYQNDWEAVKKAQQSLATITKKTIEDCPNE